MRTFKTIGIVIGMYLAAFVSDVIVASGSPDYEGGVALIVLLAFLAFLATKVGYRWFDCFFAAIPIYGIFFNYRNLWEQSKILAYH
jgi:uncharacterized protein YacL